MAGRQRVLHYEWLLWRGPIACRLNRRTVTPERNACDAGRAINSASRPTVVLSGWTLHDFRDGRIDYVYAEKTTGGRRVPVVRGSADVASVSTSQATVAWDSTLHEKSDICGFNLTSRRPFVVCDAPGRQIEPPIDGDVVVWKDGRDGGSDIRGANIVTSKDFVVSNARVANGCRRSLVTSSSGRMRATEQLRTSGARTSRPGWSSSSHIPRTPSTRIRWTSAATWSSGKTRTPFAPCV